jgi:hypothetical protein
MKIEASPLLVRGWRRSCMKIEAAPLPRSRLAPLLHENRSRAASSFAAGAAPA